MSKVLLFVIRVTQGLASRFRISWFSLLGVQFTGKAWLQKVSIPRNHAAIALGDGVALDDYVTLLVSNGANEEAPKIRIGAGTYVNRFSFIDASHKIIIGENVGIGPYCYITDHDHGMDPSRPILSQKLVSEPTTIEDDVWLGANVCLLKGVTIGRGSIVATGSVVARSIPPGVVAEGKPARVVKRR